MKQLFSMEAYRGLRICVAISGGRDSVALLHYFCTHAKEFSVTLSAVTCEHGIRGTASISDLQFVENLCDTWGIPLSVYREDVPALSKKLRCGVEEAGRVFRYECFRNVLQCGVADVIATAHHQDDFAETILFRLARGTALSGMDAFPTRDDIVRPLLHTTRAEIDAYVAGNGLAYVEDASNSDVSYTRNALRHHVLPALESAVPRATQNLVRFAERAAKDDEYLQELAREAVCFSDNELHISLALPQPILSRACVIAVKYCGITHDYTEAMLAEILSLRVKQNGKRVLLSTQWEIVKEADELVFYRASDVWNTFPFSYGTFFVDPYTLIVSSESQPNALRFDRDALPMDTVVRRRAEGDIFTPFGGQQKTLKKYLTDKKIPSRIGKSLPLLASGKEILAVCGVEISEKLKCTSNTMREGYLILNNYKRMVNTNE